MLNNCPKCLNKQRKIDELAEKIKRLKAKLKYKERIGKESVFGSSTPSSKIPIKANTFTPGKKKIGAKQGHKGSGRKKFEEADADRVVEIEANEEKCPQCGGSLEEHPGL